MKMIFIFSFSLVEDPATSTSRDPIVQLQYEERADRNHAAGDDCDPSCQSRK